jgi:hypothetical protein
MDASEIVLNRSRDEDGRVVYTAVRLGYVLDHTEILWDPVPRAELPRVAEWAARELGEDSADSKDKIVFGTAQAGKWVDWVPAWTAPDVPGEVAGP